MNSLDCLYFNANLMTMTDGDEGLGIIRNGVLGVSQGRIAFVGPHHSLEAFPDLKPRESIDLQGGWIGPGLVECHTHLVFGGNRAAEFRARLAGVSYEELARQGGGIMSTVKATRGESEDELFAAASRRCRTLLAQGVTTVEIKSGYGLDFDTERKMLRVARRLDRELPINVTTTFLGAHALPPEFSEARDGYVDYLCDRVLPALVQEELVDAVDGFCENIAFSRAEIDKVFSAAEKLGLPVKLHAEQLSCSGGAALVAGYRGLSADHLEYLDDEAVAAMAEAGTVAVLLPGAFFLLGETRLPPVQRLRELCVPMAVATDCNPGSSPVLSPRLMMSMACRLFGLTVEESLLGTTRHAAAALGLSGDRGTLERGKRADFVIWDITAPEELVYWMGDNRTVEVICGGRPLGGF